MRAPTRGTNRIAAIREARKRGQRGVEEPAQPDAFSAAFRAYVIEAVIPVAAADQRDAVGSELSAVFDRANAVLPQDSAGRGDRRD